MGKCQDCLNDSQSRGHKWANYRNHITNDCILHKIQGELVICSNLL